MRPKENVLNQNGNFSSTGDADNSTKKLAKRSVTVSRNFPPFSAVAQCGLPDPLFVVSKCQGRVIETQPLLIASNRDFATEPSSANSLPVTGSVATRCGFRN